MFSINKCQFCYITDIPVKFYEMRSNLIIIMLK